MRDFVYSFAVSGDGSATCDCSNIGSSTTIQCFTYASMVGRCTTSSRFSWSSCDAGQGIRFLRRLLHLHEWRSVLFAAPSHFWLGAEFEAQIDLTYLIWGSFLWICHDESSVFQVIVPATSQLQLPITALDQHLAHSHLPPPLQHPQMQLGQLHLQRLWASTPTPSQQSRPPHVTLEMWITKSLRTAAPLLLHQQPHQTVQCHMAHLWVCFCLAFLPISWSNDSQNYLAPQTSFIFAHHLHYALASPSSWH